MKIIMMGPQGSGKGTQAKLLASKLGIPHLSTGDLLRAEVAAGTDIGREAKAVMESGKLVSDDIIRKVLEKKLAGPDCVRGFIADGFPRNLAQALKLQPIRRVDHAIHLFVDTQTTIERLTSRINCPKCGEVYGPGKPPKRDGVCDKCNAKLIKRQDDAALEAVVQRLELYWTEMLPILEYYRYAGVLTTINGVQSIDAIAAQIAKAVNA